MTIVDVAVARLTGLSCSKDHGISVLGVSVLCSHIVYRVMIMAL